MTHVASPEFWRAFENLPETVQVSARKNFELLKINPHHPSLHFKKAGRFWSVRVNTSFRALAVGDGKSHIWFWIGPHDEYLRIVKSR